MRKSFIILDRDGVINFDSSSYIKSPAEWKAIPGSLPAISLLNQAGYQVLVATNQSGVSRGLYDLNTLHLIHQKMRNELATEGGNILEIFYCPHRPDDNCHCRKPKIGMIQAMIQKYAFIPSETYFIGDSLSDVQAANQTHCKPMLVLTGNGRYTLKNYPDLKNSVPYFENLAAAVDYIVNSEKDDV